MKNLKTHSLKIDAVFDLLIYMAIDRKQDQSSEGQIIRKADRVAIECDPSWRLPRSLDDDGMPSLTKTDVTMLDRYKWRYSLESHGFSRDQAARLLFVKWELKRGR